jgi:hypothetical protein
MAERILHKSLSKESNKTESSPDSEIRPNECWQQSPENTEPIRVTEEILPLIQKATVYNLSGTADYSVGILLQTLINLSRLHDELTKLQEMLVKGGGR